MIPINNYQYLNQAITDDLQKRIGANMRRVRLERGFSLADIEREVGIPVMELSRLERASIKNTSIQIIHKLADLYDLLESEFVSELLKDIQVPERDIELDAYQLDFDNMYPFNLIARITDELSFNVDLLRFQESLSELSFREQEILRIRYKNHKTLEETGKYFGVTRERIRQLENKALRRLKSKKKHFLTIDIDEHEQQIQKLSQENYQLKQLLDKVLAANFEYKLMANDSQTMIPTVPLEEMNLSVRSYNALMRHGIRNANDLSDMTMDELMNIKNLGMKSIREIRGKLVEMGLSFKG